MYIAAACSSLLLCFKSRAGYFHPPLFLENHTSQKIRRQTARYMVLVNKTFHINLKHFNIIISYLNITNTDKYIHLCIHMCVYRTVCVVSFHTYSKDIRCSSKHSHANRLICELFFIQYHLKELRQTYREHVVMILICNVRSSVRDCISGGQAGEDQQLRASNKRPTFLSSKGPNFEAHKWSWNEQKSGHGSDGSGTKNDC